MAEKIRLWIDLDGEANELKDGVMSILPDIHGELDGDGVRISLKRCSEDRLSVSRRGNDAYITYKDRIHFFRALGILAEHFSEEEFDICENISFDTNGVMFDVSQSNTLMTVEHAKKLLRRMALMGLNMVMFYNEANYEIEKWPYFGYMRSRFSAEDIKEIDDYAYALGIEQIPCIQTLAHLTDALRWPSFSGMRENDACLLPGEEKVYEFIEDMIVAASSPVRSKRIHIGFDEAMQLGMGKYYKLHGPTDAGEIMFSHLNRVMEILRRHGLRPMFWGDMFMQRVFGKYSCYQQDYGRIKGEFSECVLPNGVRQKADFDMLKKYPEDAWIISYQYDPEPYEYWETLINQGKFICKDTIFAGGIWGWTSFCPNWRLSFGSALPALEACKNNGVREVFATTWGDEQTECPVDTLLLGMQLWAEMGYSDVYDEEKLKKRYEFITGASYEATLRLQELDAIPGTQEGNPKNFNASKCLLWQEPMCGIHDKDIEGLEDDIEAHYRELSEYYLRESEKDSDLQRAFGLYARLASLLEIKATIGCRLKSAYDLGDREALRPYAEEVLPELIKRAEEFYEYHRSMFYDENKPFGFEIFDIRHRAMIGRCRTALWRIEKYLSGEADELIELKERKLYMHGAPSLSLDLCYAHMISAGRLTSNSGWPISKSN